MLFCRQERKTGGRSKSIRKRPDYAESEESDFYIAKPVKKLHKQPLENKSKSLLGSYEKIKECPTVYLTEEQMKGDLAPLLEDLEDKYSEYGAVKIVACQSWNPPVVAHYVNKGLTTRVQVLQQLSEGKGFEQKIEAYSQRTFERYALAFEKKYIYKTNPPGKTQVSKDEHEFWSLVTKPEYKHLRVEVEYAADLAASTYGSGFPNTARSGCSDSTFDYRTSLFNLNNIYKSPESMLAISDLRNEQISGVSTPWVYLGMKFSSFCWHVEDLYISSINYNHRGSSKIWYIIPSSNKQKFDQFARTKMPKTLVGKPDALHRITFMVDPLEIIAAGINVYKIDHTPRSYVFTFPKVYHAGFSTGLNMGEAVNFLTYRSLDAVKDAYQEYESCGGKKMAIFPYEWLIYENYLIAQDRKMSDKQNKIIEKEYKLLVKSEYDRVQQALAKNKVSSYSYIPQKKLKYEKNMCSVCKNYCYLSYFKCTDCGKIRCLTHKGECCLVQYELVIRKPNKDFECVMKLLAKCTKTDEETST